MIVKKSIKKFAITESPWWIPFAIFEVLPKSFFQILEDEISWKFLHERFQYLLHIYENPHVLESFEPLPAYLGVRVAKPKMDKVIVTSDP